MLSPDTNLLILLSRIDNLKFGLVTDHRFSGKS